MTAAEMPPASPAAPLAGRGAAGGSCGDSSAQRAVGGAAGAREDVAVFAGTLASGLSRLATVLLPFLETEEEDAEEEDAEEEACGAGEATSASPSEGAATAAEEDDLAAGSATDLETDSECDTAPDSCAAASAAAARALARRPELWLNLPRLPAGFSLAEAHLAHIEQLRARAPELLSLMRSLVPRRLTSEVFWLVYFARLPPEAEPAAPAACQAVVTAARDALRQPSCARQEAKQGPRRAAGARLAPGGPVPSRAGPAPCSVEAALEGPFVDVGAPQSRRLARHSRGSSSEWSLVTDSDVEVW